MKTLTVAVRNQREADELCPRALAEPADLYVLMVGPMEGPLEARQYLVPHFEMGLKSKPSWPPFYTNSVRSPFRHVICFGGEQPVHPDWVRGLRDQCQAAFVPFAFTGWGEWAPNYQGVDVSDYSSEEVWLAKDGDSKYWLNDQCEDTPLRVVMNLVGNEHSGRSLDGQVWDQRPEATA